MPNTTIHEIATPTEGQGSKASTTANAFESMGNAMDGRFIIDFDVEGDANFTVPDIDALLNRTFRAIGTITVARDIVVPSNVKGYDFINDTTGGFDIQVLVAAQTGILIPNGESRSLVSNGVDIEIAPGSDFTTISKIEKLNTSVEVFDTGTDGRVVSTIDGVEMMRLEEDKLTLKFGTMDYEFGIRSSVVLTLQSKTAATNFAFEVSSNDADNTDFVQFAIFGFGHGGDANTERLTIGFEPADNEYTIVTSKGGTGTARNLLLKAGSNDDQIMLDVGGWVTFATQPSFEATASLQSSKTGGGASYDILFATESYDRGGNFASPSFTAPATALYDASGVLDLTGVAAGHILSLQLVTTGKAYKIAFFDIGILQSGGAYRLNWSLVGIPLTATNTAKLVIVVTGGADTDINIATDSTFSMALAA